jgi:cell division protein FtsI/penicillin-binding protein 2
MIQPAQYRRLALMALLLLIAFAGLGYRLVDLQVLRHEDLSREATFTRERTIIHASRRGDILDARGDVLATTLFVKTVFADSGSTKPNWPRSCDALSGPTRTARNMRTNTSF